MSEHIKDFESPFNKSMNMIDEQIFNYLVQLERCNFDNDKYESTFNKYVKLIETRGQLIEQQEKLLKIHKTLIPNAIINGDKIIPMGDLDSFEKDKDKKKNHNDAYSAFIDSINSPTYAEMREIKEGFGFKKK